MTRPEMTCEIAITSVWSSARLIDFDSTPDAASDLEQFGVYLDKDKHPRDKYCLKVDARYNFGEVLAYIEQYGKAEA